MQGKQRRKRAGWLFAMACIAVTALYGICGFYRQDRQEETDAEAVEVVKHNDGRGTNAASSATVLRAYLGALSAESTPFHWETEGDRRLLSLQYQQLDDLARITVRRSGKDAQTVYRIRLTKDVMDTEGRLVTADTLVYNLYLRYQAGYQGEDAVTGIPVRGRDAYRYGVSGKTLQQRRRKVRRLLQSPGKKLERKMIRTVVLPALRREMAWVRALYGKEPDNAMCRKYPDAISLFAYYYAPDTTYTGEGKTEETALWEIAAQYGTQTERLSEVTGRDYAYLMENAVICMLWPQQKAGSGRIAGIRRCDERTVEVTVSGYQKKYQKWLGNLLVCTGQRKNGTWIGTGQYQQTESELSAQCVTLQASSYYARRAETPVSIAVTGAALTSVQCIRGICGGSLDLACIWDSMQAEKKEIAGELQKGDALWKAAVLEGVVYHPARVNATTVSGKAAKKQEADALLEVLEMNETQ